MNTAAHFCSAVFIFPGYYAQRNAAGSKKRFVLYISHKKSVPIPAAMRNLEKLVFFCRNRYGMHEKNDPTAANMLDLIRDTLRFDFSMTFANAIRLVYTIMGDNLQNKNANIASSLRSHQKLDQAYIDQIYETYAKIKQ